MEAKNIGKGRNWVLVAKGGSFRKWYGNIHDVINWSNEARAFYKSDKIARIQNEYLWFRNGITWNLVSSTGTGFRVLEDTMLFNKAAPTILFDTNKLQNLEYILGYLNTSIVKVLLSVLNPTFNTNIAEVLSLPLIENKLVIVSRLVNFSLTISKKDWTSYETSWDFDYSPLISTNDNRRLPLEDSYNLWMVMVTAQFYQLHAIEEELNHIFIEIYGLNEELDPVDIPMIPCQ